jgi:serine/threonine-protein kinase
MNPSLVNDHESATRFAREASNAAQILHPNVAAVFDFGESDRTVYLVMEYVDGEPLSRILNQEGALEPRRAVDIACQIAEGLTAAHELGIVHRDLKPDNVIVTQARTGRDVPKIVDFGIAKAASETPQDALTRSGLVIGTPEYMSPEQLLGDPIDARTDVYSLGCILYQMLTGSTPFADESREQMIRRRLHEAPPRVRDVIPGLPRRLDATIAHMLARSPSERLASAADARSALDPGLIFAEWVPQANPVARISPPKRNSGGKRISGEKKRISGEVVDPSLQETVPIPKQHRSVRSMGVGLVLAAALLVAGRALWLMKPVTAPLPDVDSAAPAPLSPSAGATTPAPESAVATKPQQRRDSNVRTVKPPPVTLADTTTPRAPLVTSNEDPLHRPIDRFRAAMATGDMAAVREVYSGAPDFASFFADIERIRGQVRFIGAPTIVDDHAELDFDLILTYEKKKSRTENTQTQIKYHALLRRESGVWHIEKLTQRN